MAPRSLLIPAAAAMLALAPACARLASELRPPKSSTVLEPYPRHDDPDAVAFNDLPIRLYFFTQTPPEGTEIREPVRVVFSAEARDRTCREAGIAGLQKLQRVAMRAKVNAVVNLRSTWEGAQLGDALRFGCRRAGGEHMLIWEGALAQVPETPEAPPADADPAAETGSASARLRELNALYYQGLITREEYLEKKKRILDGL